MVDITLKYLTELAAATSVSSDDLIHINQDGKDRSVTAGVLRSFMIDAIHPVGVTLFFATSQNPNNLFPNTSWQRIPGYGRTIRLANEGMSDVLQTGGNDTVTLSIDNMPAHNHEFSGNTSNFDYGTKTTSANGQHSHNIPGNITTQDGNTNAISGGRVGIWTANKQTTENGSHTHTVQIGSHSHNFSGNTGSTGGGQPFTTKNEYINLIAWYRIS